MSLQDRINQAKSLGWAYGTGRAAGSADSHMLELWYGEPGTAGAVHLDLVGGYAPVEVEPGDWGEPSPSTGVLATLTRVYFPTPTGAWSSEATHWLLRDPVTGRVWDTGRLGTPINVLQAGGEAPWARPRVFYTGADLGTADPPFVDPGGGGGDPDPPPGPDPDPGPSAPVLLGMSTEYDLWASRVAQTGPVFVRRVFVSSWNIAQAMTKIRAAHSSGCLPYASLKFPGSWASVASGSNDAGFAALGEEIAALPYDVRLTYHHEPRGGGISTPTQLIPWSDASTRGNNIIKAIAPNAILGPCDNGFMFPRATGPNGSKLTDEELAIYYTEDFLESCDVLGCDTYDGETDESEGEPAYLKAQGFADWAGRIGFPGSLDIGEWNFVEPEDAGNMYDVLSDPGNNFWAASCFNSGAQNRPDLPSELNGSWVLTGARLAAFIEILDAAHPTRWD